MELKDTLLLPQTSFEMRGNLGVREVEFQSKWESMDLYNRVLKQNEGNTPFVLHDGPPYANGAIHIGHALNKILKDFVLRYKTMKGFYAPYIPGWDTHGLPIEQALTKKGVNRKEMTVSDFRRLCHDYALEQVKMQKVQFKRLGILGEWDNPYITLNPSFEADQLRVFGAMAAKGLIYKGLKPVYWSPSSESALAEAEIEYEEVTSPSIYVAFEVVEGPRKGQKLIIWTTTPWTLPANLAISANPTLTYVVVQNQGTQYIVAKSLLEKVSSVLKFENPIVVDTFPGTDLEFVKYTHPLNGRICPVILGEHVTDTDGTGLVHTAPGHGEDDYNVGKKYNLDILVPVDDRGMFTKEALEFEGIYYEKANPLIIEKLQNMGNLLHVSYFKHSYPHDWRTKKPIIFRATPQWFASIDLLKQPLLEEIKHTNWIQKWGELRIHNMIKDRNDWCISRQRAWGVPIPVFYAENGEAILDQAVINHVATIVEEKGTNAWLDLDVKDLLPKGFTHPGSPNGIFKKETDIMDVWFDSGSSHKLLARRGLSYPADLYLEGSDQYRGWFNSSLITGVALYGKAPYKAVVSHGFVLDKDGRAMSKSLGNTTDPLKITSEMGADILRLWVSSVEYASDVRIGDQLMKQVSESYRKIRNTFKFLLSNLFDFNPSTDLVPYNQLGSLDKVMLHKLEDLKQGVYESFDQFRFDVVYRQVNNYMINDLSAFYLDYTKDILYVESQKGLLRRSVQTVLYEQLMTLLKVLNPILPHTTSEAYWALPFEHLDDVYLEKMPEVNTYSDRHLDAAFEDFMRLRDELLKQLEDMRKNKVIGKSLEAGVKVTLPKDMRNHIESLNVSLTQVLMVSSIELHLGESLNVETFVAEGHKCERCWNIVAKVDEQHVCPRCAAVLKGE
ncbi:isoleucine--tRNA ligase [Acholeplasma vituli]|uniref:Isoleucine--tRNA ligase n=1 Tax=Paracholeplasma vituli TaxID=69473 RepID=A0ABT2PV28_9MOLU|nr:isoleucine--tRNA ligase [Paracholeplasma vituli]MCU0104805.1 isoleucine--tRNA ligase [Paracholeplasma vituli]